MKKVLYYLADVFTDKAFGGNQLAVFPAGQEVPEHLMQRIAKELNLSETTFVLPPVNPQNDIKLRIFTPGKELPMAGHPTIGTAYILLQQKLLSFTGSHQLIFEEGVGDIPVTFEQDGQDLGLITMSQPLPEFGQTVTNTQVLADLLSINPEDIATESPAQVVSCGVPFLFVPLKSLTAVKKARIRTEILENQLSNIGTESVFLFSLETEQLEHTVHGRMFSPAIGIPEDPATGSACGPLGCYLVHHELVPVETDTTEVKIICEQGFEMGRPSLLYITIGQQNNTITGVKVGGKSVLVGEGYLYI